tara:strand:- start:6724 stop:7002 length:279 start_codon:yes stop_codon:yes gene_type:complete
MKSFRDEERDAEYRLDRETDAMLEHAEVMLEAEIERLENELANANDLLHDVVLGHNLRTKNREMWNWQLYEDEGLTMLNLHEWFLAQQGEEE